MTAAPFMPGWCLVAGTDGSMSVLWVDDYPVSGPLAWVIAGPTRDACASAVSCSFIADLSEFEEHMLISRIDPPALSCCDSKPEKEPAHG